MKFRALFFFILFVLAATGSLYSQRGHVMMNFDSVPDFSLVFGSWQAVDGDGDSTYIISNHTFPHSGGRMAFLSFNPAQVSPSMSNDTALQAHSGSKFGACFSSLSPPNNDWFISPAVQLSSGGSFSFWVKSYTAQYGLEQFRVAVSTTDSLPSSFTVISGAIAAEAPDQWTKKTYSLSNYKNQRVFVAIQCVSNDHYIFMIDDLDIDPGNNDLPSYIIQDFENVPSFTLNLDPWTTRDLVGGATYSMDSCEFPNEGAPMAWICFDPQNATPPPANMEAHSGGKMAACISSVPPHNPNNKWLISPQLNLQPNAKISLWVKTYNAKYGLEQYNIAISVTDNDPAHFTPVSGSTPLSAPTAWTQKTFNLNAYTGQNVFIGIQCVSNDQFVLLVDDIEIGLPSGYDEHPFKKEVCTVFPNPVTDRLFLGISGTVTTNVFFVIYNNLGETIKSGSFIPGKAERKITLEDLPAGIYFLEIMFNGTSEIKKIIKS